MIVVKFALITYARCFFKNSYNYKFRKTLITDHSYRAVVGYADGERTVHNITTVRDSLSTAQSYDYRYRVGYHAFDINHSIKLFLCIISEIKNF